MSTCRIGKGSGSGLNAFSARRSSAIESFSATEQQDGSIQLRHHLSDHEDGLRLEGRELGDVVSHRSHSCVRSDRREDSRSGTTKAYLTQLL